MEVTPAVEIKTKRLRESPWKLIRTAAGSQEQIVEKLQTLVIGLQALGKFDELDSRLDRLHKKGLIEEIPNRVQLAVGGIDMLRFWISPAAADYYKRHKINFAFHQLLRFLEDPCSVMNLVGILSERDSIIGHLMQVVHANPDYDLQLLEMFDDGLEQLELQLSQVLRGTHPRASSIHAIVEEPDYHARLYRYVCAWRRGIVIPSLLRSNIVQNENFFVLNQTFGTLKSAMRYFTRLPSTVLGGVLHLLENKSFYEAI